MTKQEETLKTLDKFVGFPLVKIPVKAEAVGWHKRYRSDRFPFLPEHLKSYGYVELTKGKADGKT